MSEALDRHMLVVLIEAHLMDLEARGYARLTVRDYALWSGPAIRSNGSRRSTPERSRLECSAASG